MKKSLFHGKSDFSHVQVSDFISGEEGFPLLLRKGISLWGAVGVTSFKEMYSPSQSEAPF